MPVFCLVSSSCAALRCTPSSLPQELLLLSSRQSTRLHSVCSREEGCTALHSQRLFAA
ncbi:unnamed protein product [Chondrus crispus]|uniref:Uncharacterized protein n=1 Tax=Chondrus crispus TaxID=2769 RepID=R7QRZ2_CHOCR|nr:unnamed protein product [Chondrus crispus]CDF40478.1 unnamed protein product [Chondrus crispus]|eukprot:XP_005710772.1 unnamed protein product [Chondrus crispus]